MNGEFRKAGIAFLSLIIVSSLLFASKLSAQDVSLKLAHFMPTMHVQHEEAFVPFGNNVEKYSEGKKVPNKDQRRAQKLCRGSPAIVDSFILSFNRVFNSFRDKSI